MRPANRLAVSLELFDRVVDKSVEAEISATEVDTLVVVGITIWEVVAICIVSLSPLVVNTELTEESVGGSEQSRMHTVTMATHENQIQ